MWGNTVALLALAKWEGAFDAARFRDFAHAERERRTNDAPEAALHAAPSHQPRPVTRDKLPE